VAPAAAVPLSDFHADAYAISRQRWSIHQDSFPSRAASPGMLLE
jgi:hypothetical protein